MKKVMLAVMMMIACSQAYGWESQYSDRYNNMDERHQRWAEEERERAYQNELRRQENAWERERQREEDYRQQNQQNQGQCQRLFGCPFGW